MPPLREYRPREGADSPDVEETTASGGGNGSAQYGSCCDGFARTADAASRPMGHRLVHAAVSGTRPTIVSLHGSFWASDWLPHSAFLSLTSDCPADCWHCSLKGRRPAKDLTTDQWLDVIAQLHQLAAISTTALAFSANSGRRTDGR